MKKTEIQIEIRDILLGVKKAKNPMDDKTQYLVIDDFEVNLYDKNRVYILPTKTHIKEYDATYCVTCAKEGKRNQEAPYGVTAKDTGKFSYYCRPHYAEYKRKNEEFEPCPQCKNGVLITCGIEGEDECCVLCDYRRNVRPSFCSSFRNYNLVNKS